MNGSPQESTRPQDGSRFKKGGKGKSTEQPLESGWEQGPLPPIRIYPYGVARNRLNQAARRLGVPAVLVKNLGDADVLLTLRSHYRKRQRPVVDAENRGMSIYVLRANTINQIQQFLSDLYNISVDVSR